MKLVRFLLVGFVFTAFAVLSHAESAPPPKEKSPADIAYDDFTKLVNEKEAKQDQARFKKVIATGLEFIVQNPAHRRAGDAINTLATYGPAKLNLKGQEPLRASWLSLLEYEVLNYRLKEGLSDDARTAVAAMESALAGARASAVINRDTLETYREKIDALAAMPGAGRFLEAQERGYAQILVFYRPSAGEAHLKNLLGHSDKKVAAMARDELNLVEVAKEPFELKFTALDGKEFDMSAHRGKVVALVFFTSDNEASIKNLALLKEILWAHKKEIMVVGVSFDKEADRAKVEKTVKQNGLNYPVYFDGTEAKNEWARKLNVKKVPAIVVFNPKGFYVTNNQRPDRMEAELKRQLGTK